MTDEEMFEKLDEIEIRKSRERTIKSYVLRNNVISDKDSSFFGTECSVVQVPETKHWTASSLFTFIPICLLMGYIQEALGEKAGRGCEGPWSFSKGAACVRNSEKVIL